MDLSHLVKKIDSQDTGDCKRQAVQEIVLITRLYQTDQIGYEELNRAFSLLEYEIQESLPGPDQCQSFNFITL